MKDLKSEQSGLLVVSETLSSPVRLVRKDFISRSMMESWNRNVSSTDLGIRVVLRRGGEVSDQHNSGSLYNKTVD